MFVSKWSLVWTNERRRGELAAEKNLLQVTLRGDNTNLETTWTI